MTAFILPLVEAESGPVGSWYFTVVILLAGGWFIYWGARLLWVRNLEEVDVEEAVAIGIFAPWFWPAGVALGIAWCLRECVQKCRVITAAREEREALRKKYPMDKEIK